MLSLSAECLTIGEESAQLVAVYGSSVSKDTNSKITDAVLEGTPGRLIRPARPRLPCRSSTRSTSRSATARAQTVRSTVRSESPSTVDADIRTALDLMRVVCPGDRANGIVESRALMRRSSCQADLKGGGRSMRRS